MAKSCNAPTSSKVSSVRISMHSVPHLTHWCGLIWFCHLLPISERLHLSPLPKRPSIFDAISFRSGRSRQASLFDTTSIYSHTSDTDSSWTSNVKTMLNVWPTVERKCPHLFALQSYSETRSAKSYHSIGIMMYVRYLLFGSCWAVLLAVMLIFIVGEVMYSVWWLTIRISLQEYLCIFTGILNGCRCLDIQVVRTYLCALLGWEYSLHLQDRMLHKSQ